MLHWRFFLGSLIIAAVIVLCWLDCSAAVPGTWLLSLLVAFAMLATQETLNLLAAAGMKPVRWLVYLGNAAVLFGAWTEQLVSGQSMPSGLHRAIFLALKPETLVSLFLFAMFLAEMLRYRKPGGTAANLAGGLLAFLYIGIMLRYVVLLRLHGGVGVLAAWILAVKMCDTGAYAAGWTLGRHKMAPLLSPGKTMEGAIGGLAAACLGSWIAFRWLVPLCSPTGQAIGPWWGWIVFGLLVGAAGMFGDLAESLLKRDVGRKESSDWLPGFGGVLDIFDSLLLSAPVAWFCWTLL